MLKWITPSLAVAEDWPEDDTFTDADAATNNIQLGGMAVVASEALAAEVLHNLGLSAEEIEDRFLWAGTGRVL